MQDCTTMLRIVPARFERGLIVEFPASRPEIGTCAYVRFWRRAQRVITTPSSVYQRTFEAQGLSWPLIEAQGDLVEVCLGEV